MATYLLTEPILNVSVSCFASYDSSTNPKLVNLLTWLRSTKYQSKIETLRQIGNKEGRDKLKSTLPAITPSGQFTYRAEANLIPGSHTGLIQFDIDAKDNSRIRNYSTLKDQISKLPFVAYCGLSASGKGYWGLVPVAYPERHGQHFDALKRVFAHYGINVDTKPRNVVSLRGYSYDSAPYMPQRVMLFELYDVPPKSPRREFSRSNDADTEQERVEVCIQEVLRRGTYIGDSYEQWYEVGCSLANGFGEGGRSYFHHVSQNYPSYQSAQTDKQFTACLRANSKATLGTFFHLCQQLGIEWKELMPVLVEPYLSQAQREPTQKPAESPLPSPLIVTNIREQLTNPGSILRPDESQLERLTVEPWASYPADWDTAPTFTQTDEPQVSKPVSVLDRLKAKNPYLDLLINTLDLELIS